jgi:hypothetical protein
MLRSSTGDSPFSQNDEATEQDAVEESQSEQGANPIPAEDDVSGFAEPPVISTD